MNSGLRLHRVVAGIGEAVHPGRKFAARFAEEQLGGFEDGGFEVTVSVTADKPDQPVLKVPFSQPKVLWNVIHSPKTGHLFHAKYVLSTCQYRRLLYIRALAGST